MSFKSVTIVLDAVTNALCMSSKVSKFVTAARVVSSQSLIKLWSTTLNSPSIH